MCVIITKSAGVKPLDTKYFSKAWDSNSDGGGIVWKKKDEQVMIQKGFMTKKEMMDKLNELNEEDTSFIAHFRIKSVGNVCAQNTHPFNMDNVTFAHNGTLSIKPFEGMTDSETFGLCFLKDKSMDWIKEYKVLLEMALGTSKFAIMDNVSGEILILNKGLGQERDGAWFSNSSAFQTVPMAYKSYSSYEFNEELNKYQIKGRATFGTKKHVEEFAFFDQDKECWCWKQSLKEMKATFYHNVVISKRGFYRLDIEIEPNDELENKAYKNNCKEIQLLNDMQNDLQADLYVYQNTFYNNYNLRKEAEEELSAKFTVIDCMKRLIKANKKINEKSLKNFCVDNIKNTAGASASPSYTGTYKEFVELTVGEVLDTLK